MSLECINPELRDWIRVITNSSFEQAAALDFGELSYPDVGEARLHWNCCPACRDDFPNLPALAERAGRAYEKCFVDDLSALKDEFLAKKHLLLASGDNHAYTRIIAELATAEDEVHQGLQRSLIVKQNIYLGLAIGFDPSTQAILSQCRDFVSSLDSDVQHFVIATTLCFELLRPMYERVGLIDTRTPEEIREQLAKVRAGIKEEPKAPKDVKECLGRAISESGLEPKVLWDIIDSATSARVSDGTTAGVERLLQALKADFDDFADSMKAGQMEAIRLSERSRRKADDCEADVVAQIGRALYSKLAEMTRQHLKVAEFLYHINSMEPNYFDGPVIAMAKAYESELKVRIVFPVLKQLMDSHQQNYGSNEAPLIKAKEINGKKLTVGNIGWHLKNYSDFCDRVQAIGFDPTAISKDAAKVTHCRNVAAHEPVCERAVADEMRRLILTPDGILSRLHPSEVERLRHTTQ